MERGARVRTDYPSPAVHRFPKKCQLSQVTDGASRSKVSRIGRMEISVQEGDCQEIVNSLFLGRNGMDSLIETRHTCGAERFLSTWAQKAVGSELGVRLAIYPGELTILSRTLTLNCLTFAVLASSPIDQTCNGSVAARYPYFLAALPTS
jgi:hypothetical protein